MITIVLIIHCFIVIALVGVVLMQRSEGGALGMGGGGGAGGGLMSGRAAATALTRTTSILAALFFATSLGLAIFADRGDPNAGLVEDLLGEEAGPNLNLIPGEVSGDDLLEGFGPSSTEEEPAPDAAGDDAPAPEAEAEAGDPADAAPDADQPAEETPAEPQQ